MDVRVVHEGVLFIKVWASALTASGLPGSTVYEARLRLDRRDSTVVLEATRKSDAIRELEALRVDRDRGRQRHRW